jgi:hypothetical protein
MNIVAVPLLFNYVDRSWAMGVDNFFCFLLRIPTFLLSDNATEYRNIIGGLQYLTITHPNISYDVNRLCQLLHAPKDSHMTVVKRILCCIITLLCLIFNFRLILPLSLPLSRMWTRLT